MKPPIRLALASFLGLAAAMALPAAAGAQLHEREIHITVYGDDPCPTSRSDTEVVVCARRPETERYRIPRRLRDRRNSEASWASRSEQLEEAQVSTRPNGCSVVGAWGQTGCTAEAVRAWYAERRAARAQARAEGR